MRALLALALLVPAACRDEPNFDERYKKADAEIRAKAAEIDRSIEGATAATPGAEATPRQ